MNEHDEITEHGEHVSPDPTLVSVCSIACIMQFTKNVLNHLNGLGIAVPDETTEGTVDDRISREVYKQISNMTRGIQDV